MIRTSLFAAAMLTLAGPALAGSPGKGPGMAGAHFIENWDLDGDGQVSLEEATEKRGDIFYMFDQDESGLLDAEEYKLFDETREEDMKANAGGHGKGKPMERANRGMMLDFNDVDGDGAVSRQEFTSKTADWFGMVDKNGDGVVTADDFGPRKP